MRQSFFEIAGQKEKKSNEAAVMARPEAVVKQALLDAREGKELSVYGTGDEGSRGGNKAASAQM